MDLINYCLFLRTSLIAQLVKNPPARPRIFPWAGKIRWRRDRLPTPVFYLFYKNERHFYCFYVKQVNAGLYSHLRRKWQLTQVFLLGKSHEQRSLGSYSAWDHKKSDTIEQLNNNIPIVKICTLRNLE